MSPDRSQIDAAFQAFVDSPDFSCLAGKGVAHRGDYRLGVYGALGEPRGAPSVARDLASFASSLSTAPAGMTVFVAVFPGQPVKTEEEFERRLWTQLQALHALEEPSAGWDPSVSADPNDPRFSFSFAGRAMYVIGLHPLSSRIARRFDWPALVFNPRAQFDKLRAEGRFEPLREAIRKREIAIQGTLNPTLSDFGAVSEARQYSGRPVEDGWRCPFHKKEP